MDDTWSGFVRSLVIRFWRTALGLGLACAWLAVATAADRSPFVESDPTDTVDPAVLRPRPQGLEKIPDEPLAEVLIEGNTTIEQSEIARKIRTRPKRVATSAQLREDIKALYATKWFFSVEARFRDTENGPVLVFRVHERPILKTVAYEGNKKIKTKELESLTGLKTGSAFDAGINLEAMRRMENHYREKGFLLVKVELTKGSRREDRDVVFKIFEGPKVHVDSTRFVGNNAFQSGLLKGKLKTKTRMLWLLGGTYDPSTVSEDVQALKEYYHGLGYFDAKITPKELFSKDKSSLTIEYNINEGPRYKVRKVEFVGNKVIPESKLRTDMKIKENDFFNERFLRADVSKLTGQYGELGRIFAKIDAQPRFAEEPGTMDLVVKVDEDRPYRIRKINVNIKGEHPHTLSSVPINRMLVRPGDLANPILITRSQDRLKGSQLFERSPDSAPHIAVVKVEDEDRQLARSVVRFQSPAGDEGPLGAGDEFISNSPMQRALTSPDLVPEEQPGYVDLTADVTEAQTGSLMFGVGVNSDAGVVGNVMLQENNFDITRMPTSLQDFVDGTAFRGAGQQFRAEIVPGTQVSRYLVSWRDPYFLDQDVSFGVSGYYFNRIYEYWNERRAGGRLTLGKQLTPEWSVTGTLRLEEVKLSDLPNPSPPELLAAAGNNFLSTARIAVAHDTRDSPFLPGRGHFLEAAFEQGFGTYNYPRAEFDGRQYFTLMERPDGTGRHIVTASGNLGWTGSSTPIFENFFAGGYQSFRGFAFRGVSPVDMGVRVGGQFQMLGSLEYQIPILANDMLQAVVFSDCGTIEDKVAVDDFRLTIGAGLRVTIPAMGPAPIAIDFAVPLMDQSYDNRQLVAFFVGFSR